MRRQARLVTPTYTTLGEAPAQQLKGTDRVALEWVPAAEHRAAHPELEELEAEGVALLWFARGEADWELAGGPWPCPALEGGLAIHSDGRGALILATELRGALDID